MEERLNLQDIFFSLKKHLWIIMIVSILAASVSAVLSFFILPPVYQSSTQMIVNNEKTEEADFNDIQATFKMINTYSEIIQSPAILDLVVKELKLSGTSAELAKKITVETKTESQIFKIIVEDKNPILAAKIADATSTIFQREIAEKLNADNVNIWSEAQVNENPVKPKPFINTAIAFFAGLIISVGLIFLFEYMDNTAKTEQEIEKLGLPVIGVVSLFNQDEISKFTKDQESARKSRRESLGS
ncbi:MAG: YveK family protein [Bacillota bacterium]